MQGLIGYFDILGYQNFLENNSADKSCVRNNNENTNRDKKLIK
jgi:hypothetical protein